MTTTPSPDGSTDPAPVTQHVMSIGRYQRGKTPIRPTRPVYGTSGRCTCGWTGRWNQAPSLGGTSALRGLHHEQTGFRARTY